eukprot:gene28755-31937_t
MICSLKFRQGLAAPVINDITTDTEEPPEFSNPKIGSLPRSFIKSILKFYKNVQPLKVEDRSADEVFQAALSVAQKFKHWVIGKSDSMSGVIEGVAVTPILRFKDDWPGGKPVVRVDMRSKSRMGKSDMGVNAARIQDFMKQLADSLGLDTRRS